MKDIYVFCPLCDKRLEGAIPYGKAKCPTGHYEYTAMGSYASRATIFINEKKESFCFDDMFGDGDKFRRRVNELRAKKTPSKVTVTIYDNV